LLTSGAGSEAAEHLSDSRAIAQEALNNALKRVRDQKVRVLLDFRERATLPEISDNGCGSEPEAANRGGGPGFRGMRERTQVAGRTLRLESSPGRGTTIHVTVPTHPATC
jgi:two-component system sensor histidine kinase DegS